MVGALHRFIRFLRLAGLRISVAEAIDALAACAEPGVLADREVLRAALAACLVKDRRDVEAFDRVFDRYFALLAVEDDHGHGHSHAHDDLRDEGELTDLALSDEPAANPEQGHSHGKPADIRKYFDPDDMAQQFNLHQEANKLDMASLTDEIVLSAESKDLLGEAARVQISTDRMHNAGTPGELIRSPGMELDAELSVAEEMALLGWLADAPPEDERGDEQDPQLAALREALAPLLAGLPEKLKAHLEQLIALQHELESRDVAAPEVERIDEHDRAALEDSLRRLLRSLHGAPRPRRRVSARGHVDGRRTMRTNMRYDGIPFKPVTVSKIEDRPRIMVLCDVSLSVRATARFTLHLVHSLQSLASQVRSFAFVADCVEITDLFAEHRMEEALSLVMSGLPGRGRASRGAGASGHGRGSASRGAGSGPGGVLDVDADSDYGEAFAQFLELYGSAVTRRTTLLVLGDGRGNGNDPGLSTFEELTRRARSTVWLTPEPRYSWGLGRCDLPLYAEHCDRVQVVRTLDGLDRATTQLATPRS